MSGNLSGISNQLDIRYPAKKVSGPTQVSIYHSFTAIGKKRIKGNHRKGGDNGLLITLVSKVLNQYTYNPQFPYKT